MKVALDIGSKTIGMAKTDALGFMATPLPTIRFQENQFKYSMKLLTETLKQLNASTVIIGLPKNMDGSEGAAAERSKKYGQSIKARLPEVEIVYLDERLTSKIAEAQLLSLDKSRLQRKELSDQVAATIIMEDYLKHLKGTK